MKVVGTHLDGIVVVELTAFGDHRGRFMETYRRERYLEAGIGRGMEFVQDNFSSSQRGTLRGLHFQLTRPQGKLVHVTRGEAFDVAVDVRRGSPTFGKWFGTTLSAENRLQVWIPPGYAHGFLGTSETVDFVYKTTEVYVPSDERAVRWNDPQLAIVWPELGMVPTLSAKDRDAPLFDEADLPDYVST
jgi:dTDP-4-dehydrorhamnose 3,5-epimerase